MPMLICIANSKTLDHMKARFNKTRQIANCYCLPQLMSMNQDCTTKTKCGSKLNAVFNVIPQKLI